jgi:putative ABC transport system permease protein
MESLIAANIRQRPVRTAISMIGVALGVILIVLTVGLARGLMRDFAERQVNVDAELRFLPGGSISFSANPLTLPVQFADAIMNGVHASADDPTLQPKPPISGIEAIAPMGEWVHPGAGGIGFEIIDGIDYPTLTRAARVHVVQGRGLESGQPYEAIVDQYYADHNNARIGSRISVLDHEFTVVGIYDPPVMSRIKIPLSTMQELLGGPDLCSLLMIKLKNPADVDAVKAELERYYPGRNVVRAMDLPALYSHSIFAVEVFLNTVIGLAVVISTLVILLAMYTTIMERTREIGILKSLGASKRFIVASIEKEAVFISSLGVALGFILAIVSRYAIVTSTRLVIDLRPEWLIISGLIGVLAGVAGALYPALTAANLDAVEALSYE